jgi:hypothetical protein
MTQAFRLAAVPACGHDKPGRPFAITVIDADAGRGIPLVELRTVNGVRR